MEESKNRLLSYTVGNGIIMAAVIESDLSGGIVSYFAARAISRPIRGDGFMSSVTNWRARAII
jgi:hypothetical protein